MFKGIEEERYLQGVSNLNSLSAIENNRSRDPNGFWYKNKPGVPSKSFDIECEQWRHGIDYEDFHGMIYFRRSIAKIEGMLECVIHAENLTEPVSKTIPVKIEAETLDGRGYVTTLINNLAESNCG